MDSAAHLLNVGQVSLLSYSGANLNLHVKNTWHIWILCHPLGQVIYYQGDMRASATQ